MLQVVIGQEILLFIGKIIRFSTNLGKPLVIVVRRPSTTRGNGLMRGVKHQSGNMLDIHFDARSLVVSIYGNLRKHQKCHFC